MGYINKIISVAFEFVKYFLQVCDIKIVNTYLRS